MTTTEIVKHAIDVMLLGLFGLINEYGMFMALLSFFGLISLLSAIGSKLFKGLQYFFMIFIAAPLIIVIGLIKKDEREKRIKELGEIRAFIKEEPDRWKKVMYYFLFIGFILMMLIIVYFIFSNLISPILDFNELTKGLNLTYNATNYSQ